MTEMEVRDRILVLFNKERQTPKADFNESHFLDFLSSRQHSKNTIKNTFNGVRRYYRFMDSLELEFGICFKLADLDGYYSVDSLTKKVLERIGKGRGNLMILKERNEQKVMYWFEIVLTAVLGWTYFWLGIHWLPILLTIIFGITIWWTLSSKIYSRRHNRRLNLKFGNKE